MKPVRARFWRWLASGFLCVIRGLGASPAEALSSPALGYPGAGFFNRRALGLISAPVRSNVAGSHGATDRKGLEPMAKKPKKVWEVVDGSGSVVGVADSKDEAEAVMADHRAAGRGPSSIREADAPEGEPEAETAGG